MGLKASVNGVERSGGTFGAPEEYVGYEILDPEDRKIGRVKEMFANARGEPEYVRVRTVPLGLKTVLIPVGFVAVDEERRAQARLGSSVPAPTPACYRFRGHARQPGGEGEVSDADR
ncbi:MAG: hypothetical protein M3M97_04310 [Actinomycetota bacterium]|nr:hypothetical protein [Actinomycetota bacterium]